MSVADGAVCALHPEAPAASTCVRCGNFMCQDCGERGYERRCPRCREPVPPRLRAERRQNELRRSAVLTCRRCGYAGPKLDHRRGFKWIDVVLLPGLIAILGFGILVVLFLLRMTTPRCPACGEAKDLDPTVATPTPDAERIWRAADAADRARLQRHLLGLAAALGVVAVGVYFLFFR
jgi:hypothetical protein